MKDVIMGLLVAVIAVGVGIMAYAQVEESWLPESEPQDAAESIKSTACEQAIARVDSEADEFHLLPGGNDWIPMTYQTDRLESDRTKCVAHRYFPESKTSEVRVLLTGRDRYSATGRIRLNCPVMVNFYDDGIVYTAFGGPVTCFEE